MQRLAISCILCFVMRSLCPVDGGCIDEGSPSNGHRYPNPGGIEYSTGTHVGYDCVKGFRGEGTSPRQCQANGQWTGEPYSCKKNPTVVSSCVLDIGRAMEVTELSTCNETSVCPPVVYRRPDKETVLQRNFVVGRVITFQCDVGFSLSGKQSLTCLDGGQWNGSIVSCTKNCAADGFALGEDYVITYSTAVIGNSSDIPQYRSGTEAELKCRQGLCTAEEQLKRKKWPGWGNRYEYEKEKELVCRPVPTKLTCQSSGKWQEPLNNTCLDVRCVRDYPPEPVQGKRMYLRNLGEFHFSCNKGYSLLGSSVRQCLNGTWSGIEARCVLIQCERLSHPINGSVQLKPPLSLGSVATYVCKNGLYLIGQQRRFCMGTGLWSGRPPHCNVPACKVPHPLENGYYVGSNFTTVSRTVSVYCFRGYILYGPRQRTCEANLKWTGMEPTCISKNCSLPRTPTKGNFSFANSSIIYSCYPGYLLEGPRRRTCNDVTGRWSESDPICRKASGCVNIASPRNGERFPEPSFGHSLYKVGDTVLFSCRTGYTGSGTTARVCLEGGKWSGQPYKCDKDIHFCHLKINDGVIRVSACDPGSQANCNQLVDVSQRFDAGNTVMLRCPDGFTVDGASSIMRCQSKGGWTGWNGWASIGCAANCPALNFFDVNGKVKYTNSVQYNGKNESQYRKGTVAKLLCKAGYCTESRSFYSWLECTTASLECQEGGVWSGTFNPCISTQCVNHVPSLPTMGLVQYNASSKELRYSCTTGYALVGPDKRRCHEGVWLGDQPRCTLIHCGRPSNPENGAVHVPSDLLDKSAIYSCNPGYSLVGNHQRSCVAPGLWDGDPPICSPLPCPLPVNVTNGYYESTNTSTVVGSIITTHCFDGYYLYGSSTRLCYGNKTWSGPDPSCLPLTCNLPQKPDNGSFLLENGLAVYSCDKGFIVEGDNFRRCNPTTGKWSGAVYCRYVSCGDPGVATNGTRTGDDFSLGSVVTYICSKGFGLLGQSSTECQVNGAWSNPLPVCIDYSTVNCGYPGIFASGNVSGRDYGYGGVVTYSCNEGLGFEVRVEVTRKCLLDGTWNGLEPICYPLCPPLTLQDDSSVWREGYERRKGSVVRFGCNSGWGKHLVGSSNQTCQGDGTWSGTPGKCLYSREGEDASDTPTPNNIVWVVVVCVSVLGGFMIIVIISCCIMHLYCKNDDENVLQLLSNLLNSRTWHPMYRDYRPVPSQVGDPEHMVNTALGLGLHDFSQREYDVFYSYSSHDEEWVREELIKTLEEKYHFKGLSHDRDFIGGMNVVKNISLAVKRSKKTIAVLTPNYVESKWCQYEAINAMTTAMSTQLDSFLIPIMLKECDVPEYMRSITYIDVNDENFLERVVKALKTHTVTVSETVTTV